MNDKKLRPFHQVVAEAILNTVARLKGGRAVSERTQGELVGYFELIRNTIIPPEAIRGLQLTCKRVLQTLPRHFNLIVSELEQTISNLEERLGEIAAAEARPSPEVAPHHSETH
ncbi:MAG: hypothetical protein KW806_02135 [Candidatus Yanofskybacteria bacterium]|nr:hypothetical protein [Candidatus Yanofskybacteria bacterium]